jgi:hypothetical protein
MPYKCIAALNSRRLVTSGEGIKNTVTWSATSWKRFLAFFRLYVNMWLDIPLKHRGTWTIAHRSIGSGSALCLTLMLPQICSASPGLAANVAYRAKGIIPRPDSHMPRVSASSELPAAHLSGPAGLHLVPSTLIRHRQICTPLASMPSDCRRPRVDPAGT